MRVCPGHGILSQHKQMGLSSPGLGKSVPTSTHPLHPHSPQAAGFGCEEFEDAAAGSGYSTPWGQPSVDERDFEARFDEWWKKMSAE